MLPQTHRIIESLLFSAREPLTENQVDICLQEDVSLEEIVKELNDYYEKEKMSIWIQEVSEGYRLMTRREYDPWIRRLYQNKGKVKLSTSALETLSIVAYKQPVTHSDVDAIRGVDSIGTLKTLLEKNLIEMKGRLDGPGRPLTYGTTSYFLEYFGLHSIRDLPKISEIEEIFDAKNGEAPFEGNSPQ